MSQKDINPREIDRVQAEMEHNPDARALHEEGVEPDTLPLVSLAAQVIALCLLILAVSAAVVQFFRQYARSEVSRKDAVVNTALIESRARDRELLEGYVQVDAARGLYRIPVKRAQEILLERPELIRGVRATADPAPPAPGAPVQP